MWNEFRSQSLTPKKYLMPHRETMFKIKNNKITQKIETKKQILFGLRLCDLNSFHILDHLFLDEHPDPQYKAARERITLIGYHCNTPPNKYCFCESMNLQNHYDLYLQDKGDYYYIDVKTEKGEKLMKGFPLENKTLTIPKIKTKKHLNHHEIQDIYEHKNWESDVKKCFSCTRCTVLCPNCLCFDIQDETSIDGKEGERVRTWNSCHSRDFTKVAGGHIFREPRVMRYKHRIFHKIQWFKDQFGLLMCTGCGRCIRGCPTKIDWVKTINKTK
jgi:ferredoxin